jgi:hypothetical protein
MDALYIDRWGLQPTYPCSVLTTATFPWRACSTTTFCTSQERSHNGELPSGARLLFGYSRSPPSAPSSGTQGAPWASMPQWRPDSMPIDESMAPSPHLHLSAPWLASSSKPDLVAFSHVIPSPKGSSTMVEPPPPDT